MPDLQVFLVAPALLRVLERVLLTIIAPDPMTVLRFVLLASERRDGSSR